MATRLSKVGVFTVLDAMNAFWQMQLDKVSSYLTTFNAPFCRSRKLCLPFCIKTAPEEYQRRIHESLQNLNGIEDMVDHLCVGEGDTFESTVEDYDKHLIAFLARCREKKLLLRKKQVSFIGHLLNQDGLKPD